MSGLSLPAAELVEEPISCILYGIYLVTLGLSGRRLLTTESGRWKSRSEIRWIFVVVSVLLFLNSTVDLVVSTIMLMQAFVLYDGPGGATHIFTHGSGWQTMTKTLCVLFQTLLGDGILIYRCWYLWNKSWAVIALPLLIWFTDIACLIRSVSVLAHTTEGLVTSSAIHPWLQAFWSMTIAINIMATSLIVLRIWLVEKENKCFRVPGIDSIQSQTPSRLSHAIRNIVESGMIYTVASILTVVFYSVKCTLIYPASAVELHSVGIAFNLILIRGSQATRPSQDIPVTTIQFTQTQVAARDSLLRRTDSEGASVLTCVKKDSIHPV
ncbi:hypothetical protein B0H14DRAFT_2717029 [Mycena olivaceomarginata]|nr:hypothetical protein B0H14DRAFT_2717029 [Mycena olivaceomarginata]